MHLVSLLLHARRPLLAALLLAFSFPTVALAVAAEPELAPDDSTMSLLAWAGALREVRQIVTEAGDAAPSEAPEMAKAAFGEARRFSQLPLSRGDSMAWSLLLDAQQLYEHHHGPVALAGATSSELADLRGEALAALASDGPLGLLVAEEEVVEVVPAFPASLLFPEDAESIVAREGQRMVVRHGGAHALARRSSRYLRMIERELARRGLPDELKYLPLVESGFNPGAVSPAGAIGLWQILPSTGAMYGISEGALYDPRHSTRAATRYLAYLGGLFDGDWQLALAAYNCGPGRVQGLVRQHTRRLGRTPTYWDLRPYLPAETRAYVPRFIAVARALDA